MAIRNDLGSSDPGDFAAWVAPHLPAMTRYAARLVPGTDRDDVVQEALVRAWRRRSTYDDGRPLLSWLLAIVGDRARRHRTRTRPTYALSSVAERRSVVEPVETTAPDVDLDRAVARLSGRQRQVVDLHYFGLDVATCAQVMGCAEGTVKATLHQARGHGRCGAGHEDAVALGRPRCRRGRRGGGRRWRGVGDE